MIINCEHSTTGLNPDTYDKSSYWLLTHVNDEEIKKMARTMLFEFDIGEAN